MSALVLNYIYYFKALFIDFFMVFNKNLYTEFYDNYDMVNNFAEIKDVKSRVDFSCEILEELDNPHNALMLHYTQGINYLKKSLSDYVLFKSVINNKDGIIYCIGDVLSFDAKVFLKVSIFENKSSKPSFEELRNQMDMLEGVLEDVMNEGGCEDIEKYVNTANEYVKQTRLELPLYIGTITYETGIKLENFDQIRNIFFQFGLKKRD